MKSLSTYITEGRFSISGDQDPVKYMKQISRGPEIDNDEDKGPKKPEVYKTKGKEIYIEDYTLSGPLAYALLDVAKNPGKFDTIKLYIPLYRNSFDFEFKINKDKVYIYKQVLEPGDSPYQRIEFVSPIAVERKINKYPEIAISDIENFESVKEFTHELYTEMVYITWAQDRDLYKEGW